MIGRRWVVNNTGWFRGTDTNASIYTCTWGWFCLCTEFLWKRWSTGLTYWIACYYIFTTWQWLFLLIIIQASCIYTDRFWMTHNIAFSSLTNKRFGCIVSNYIIFKLYPLRSWTSIFPQHIIQYIDQLIRIIFSKSVLVVLQSLHMNSWILISITFILIL